MRQQFLLLQVNQLSSRKHLKQPKFRANGISTFFQGSLASATATFVGHYPWFFVYNYMSEHLPKTDDFAMKLGMYFLVVSFLLRYRLWILYSLL